MLTSPNLRRCGVETQRADRNDRGPGGITTGEGAQSGQQVAEGEWFGEVVVGAGVQPAN